MPAIDPHQQRAFERIYEYRHTEGRWPGLEDLQRRLTSEDVDIDLRAVVMGAAAYASISSAPETHEQEVRLLLKGLACVPAARPLLEAYLRAIQKIIARHRDLSAESRFTADDLRDLGLEPDIEGELSDLLTTDTWAFDSGGRPADGGPWSYAISDAMVRQARGATTVDELLARRFGKAAREDDPPPSRPGPEPPSAQPDATPSIDADRPISKADDDLLDRVQLARVLATQATGQPCEREALGNAPDGDDVLATQATGQPCEGFVMGLSGPWGSGKTSLLNLMAAAIDKAGSGYVVRFEPWLFSSSEELVVRFLRELSVQLGRKGRVSEAAARIGEYAQVLAPLTVLAGAPWLMPPISLWARLSARRRQKRAETSAHEQRTKVRDALAKLDRRLVVLIDDLDRLQAHEVRDVVRLVKLVADFPNTTYVLAYDQARVARALGGGSDRDGQEFLEKIVQLTHEVPPVDSTQLDRILSASIAAAVGDLSRYSFDKEAFINLFRYARELFFTVRDVRRYTNVLPGTLDLIGDEVEPADTLALEALRVRVPKSFALIVAGKQALTKPADTGPRIREAEERARQQVQAIVAAAGDFSEPVNAIIERLFPAALRHLGGPSYGSECLPTWRRTRRVAHPEVLDIYLNKALAPGALPAVLVERAFKALEDREALSELLDGLDEGRLEEMLRRLEHYEHDFPTTRPEIPVAVLYNQQERLQRGKQHVFDLGAGYGVPRVVLRILRKLDEDAVARVVRAALPEIRTLSGRGDLIRMVGYREGSGERLVDEDTASQLEEALFDEILATDSQALGAERDLMRLLLWVHGAHTQETMTHVGHLIEDDDFLVQLLTAAGNEVIGQSLGDASVRRIYQLNWRALTALVPQEKLVERIQRLVDPADGRELDARTAFAVEQARRYAENPAAAEEDQRNWP